MKLLLGFMERISYSIKNRLTILLVLCTMLPILTLGLVSYFTLTYVFERKIDNGIHNVLNQEGLALQGALDNMAYASVQLTYEGSIGQKFYQYLTEPSISGKVQLQEEIFNNLTLVNFTNHNVGIMFYEIPVTNQIFFENMEVKKDLHFRELPVFTNYKNLIISGPHETAYKYGKNIVFSLQRQVDVPGYDTVFVYLETNFTLFQKILNPKQYGMTAYHMLINDQGKVVYTDNGELFPTGLDYSEASGKSGYSYFMEDNLQGWKLAVAIPNGEMKREMRNWLWLFILIVSLSVLLSIWFGYAIFKMIYRPIVRINHEVQQLSDPFMNRPLTQTKIQEFDFLLLRFQTMRQKVRELILDVQREERLRGRLEVEKLMHQINPHFLYNTLNTVQWIARMNGQEEIDRLITVFSNVLQYNLGKEGTSVTLGQEAEVLQDYVTLQRIRYNYKFDVKIRLDESLRNVQIPRFILQPIVENALYHGMRDDDIIEVDIEPENEEYLVIAVKDQGKGMKPEVLERLWEDGRAGRGESGMGIGLNYVKQVLKSRYGDHLQMAIRSEVDSGTCVTIRIPISQPGEDEEHDERTDRG
ncbi:sensor histidine kinase [Paenibacillus sp. GCM10027626]|uniref:sensor histidine kinase n=1 Tax=Paenibacillus sp. GCM10027626 TaxID=3273411 RepID=UPI00363E50B6